MTAIMGNYTEHHAAHLRSPETARHHAYRIGQWCEGFRASQARQVAASIITELRPHYAPATINRSLGTLKRALTLAWEKGLTPENYGAHVRRLPENNQRDTDLKPADVEAIAQNASEQVRAAIWIALLTGARRGEILALQPADVDRTTLTLRAGNTKTLKTRVIPIVPALRPWLKFVPLQINFEGLKTGFRRAREAAKRPDVHFHDLRHACASFLVSNGVDLYTVGQILGHSTPAMTQRYAHQAVKMQRAALDKLSRSVVNQIGSSKRAPRKRGTA